MQFVDYIYDKGSIRRGIVMDQRFHKNDEARRHAWRRAQRVLDGVILYRKDFGELGLQVESLLRRSGLRASSDVRSSSKLH